MRTCPKCGTAMVRWGNPPTQRWRCPPCSQIRRDSYHTKTEIDPGAPRRQLIAPSVVIEDSDLTLFHGDCLDVLESLPDQSVHMCATSPPFWNLRNYQVEGQIGLEASVGEWVERLVKVFRDVRRVLRDDGTLWLEVGSSYVSSGIGSNQLRKPRNVPAYDNDGKELPGLLDLGLSYLGLCDGCLTDFRTHCDRSEHIAQPLEQAEQRVDSTDRDTEHSDYATASLGVVAHDTQVSTTLASWLEHRGECLDCANRQASLGQIVGCSSGLDAQASVRNLACSDDTAQLSQTSAGYNLDREFSVAAWIEEYTSRLKAKDLLPQPWLLAMALQMDGWILRSEIVWERQNAMPESVQDRPTKSHSTVLLFSKQARYYYDIDAIRDPFRDGNRGAGQGFRWNSPHYTEQDGPLDNTLGGLPPEAPRGPDGRRVTAVKGQENSHQHRDGERWPNPQGANARSVWTIPTEPTPFAHFATWPRKLVARMIQAGTSEKGVCSQCGKPWERQTEETTEYREWKEREKGGWAKRSGDLEMGRGTAGSGTNSATVPPKSYTLGWAPTCECDAPVSPATVLDPFAGSGTTMFVARALGRRSVGIELNAEYCQLAVERTQQLSLLT